MGRQSNTDAIVKIIAIVAVFGLAIYLFGDNGQTPSAPATIEIKQPGQGSQQVSPATVVVQPASTPVTASTGTLNFRLSSSMGTTPSGTSSNMLLLDKSYAVMTDGKYDEEATRFKIMKEIESSDVAALKYFTGTAKTLTHSSGVWSDTITGVPGEQGIAFTYYDTAPTYSENRTYAKLFTLSKYNSPTGEWFATLNDGKDRWTLYNHARYNFTDATQAAKLNYTYGDGGSADSNVVITWQTIALTQGDECVDCAIFVMAPDNYTSKFKDLTITARAVKSSSGPSSAKFTNLPLASISPDTISITSTTLPSRPSANDNMRFIGYIPANFDTRRTASDKNQLTWTLTTDTYGTPVKLYFYVLQNSHALGTSMGAFDIDITNPADLTEKGFPVTLGSGSTTGFNVQFE